MSDENEYDEIIKEFLTECGEHLDNLDNGFVAIEQNSSDSKTLPAIFRFIHTIKGGAGMLAFNKLEKLTHAAESLLSLLRDGKLTLNTNITTALLQTVDSVRNMLDCISRTGQDGEEEYLALIETLNQLTQVKDNSIAAVNPDSELLQNDSKEHFDNVTSMNNDSENSPPISIEPTQSTESKTSSMIDATIRINVELP